MSTVILLVLAAGGLAWSFFKDKKKTGQILKGAFNSFAKTGIEILGILSLVGLLLAWVPESTIRQLLGSGSQLLSGIFGAALGSVIIIPAFVAFPLAASLYSRGAYLLTIAAFITTLTMVGIATMPIEIRHFGKKFTFYRNLMSFMMALIIAAGMVIFL
jgi:uncharacterized membrane protein YraQ (UPF0718 family)